ncbi:uncharacterized protein LOC112512845 [Cynara cardunculus var. scolymus]|uniref:uncharacterized protein LOC112512845 n=1 Tax=Cynara cardunculus var. scolymus TaxID=59895 RepID=UPI000D624187|nr:uncharacterized protein LOC112512845 [Cynara cardunculus var. scolymus]
MIFSSRIDNDKEGEKDKEEEKLIADDDAASIPYANALIPAAEDAIDKDDDVITHADHEDHPSTSVLSNAGYEDDDEDEKVEPHLSDVENDRGDDDEDEDDDEELCIQVIPRQPVLKRISIWELAS